LEDERAGKHWSRRTELGRDALDAMLQEVTVDAEGGEKHLKRSWEILIAVPGYF
jgi:phage tail tape-measure protein